MSQNPNILIVDDELSIRTLLHRMVTDLGYGCEVVASGSEALAVLLQQDIALLIADINMPEMNGLELIEKVRPEHPELAILVMTGVDDYKVALKALEHGAYGYMLKPCDLFEIQVNITGALHYADMQKTCRDYQRNLELEVARQTAELKEINRQLQQQEKLASIGQLAAGIAHEIKVPNGYVSTNLEGLKKYVVRLIEYVQRTESLLPQLPQEQQDDLKTLQRKLKIDLILEDAEELVGNCLDGTERIKTIIQGLRDFSRKDAEVKAPVDLNQIIDESLTLVWNEIKYKAEVQRNLADIPPIEGFRMRLGQVFINLFMNAAQAISESGLIKVVTRVEGDEVVAQVIDSGSGINQECLKQIFEPFFTTKEIGVGTGLGLSIVKDIVEEHKGTISVVSQVESGTTFSLRFPIS